MFVEKTSRCVYLLSAVIPVHIFRSIQKMYFQNVLKSLAIPPRTAKIDDKQRNTWKLLQMQMKLDTSNLSTLEKISNI